MPLSRIVNNIGVGKVEATFKNLTTTSLTYNGATATPFSQANLDDGAVGASIVSSGEIGKCSTTAPLHGAVLALSNGLNGNSYPSEAVVQVLGIAGMRGTTGHAALSVNAVNRRCFQRNGLVCQATTTVTNISVNTRGLVTSIYSTDWVEVLF